MRAKKVIDFLILRPAFTSKNMSSLGLVALFFAIYVMAGGKVTWIPDVKSGQGFGTVNRAGQVDSRQEVSQSPLDVSKGVDTPRPVVSNAPINGASLSQPVAREVSKPESEADPKLNRQAAEEELARLRERLKNVRTKRDK